MKKSLSRNRRLVDISLTAGVFIFLFVFTFGILFLTPYPGFYFNPSNGEVLEIYEAGEHDLRVGDIIESIGSVSFDDFRDNRSLNIFQGLQPGQAIDIAVNRNGKTVLVSWVYPGLQAGEFIHHFFNIWLLAYLFWFLGTLTQLSIRPRDVRWYLFVAMNHLMAMFIMVGSISGYQIMGSTTLLRIIAWLLLPVYLHFHWIFPTPLRPLPRWLLFVFYSACFAVATAEFLHLTPRTLFYGAVAVAFLGSVVFLALHYFTQKEHRYEVRSLVLAAVLATVFLIPIGLSSQNGDVPQSAPLSLLALPILPIAYFYVLNRQRLAGMELRANRAISIYLFLVIVWTVLLLIIGNFGLIKFAPETIVYATIIIAVLVAGISIWLFPAFQAFVERRILGVHLPEQGLAERFSSLIVASDSLPSLMQLLKEKIFPSLLIRQYAIVWAGEASAQVMLEGNTNQAQIQKEALIGLLASFSTGSMIPPSELDPRFEWVRLILPMQVGSDLIGVWLLGRRDPDDYYPQAEVPILQSLANQTAIALSNIVQRERITAMYEANIKRYEQERLRLAHELHDSVLNEMAAVLVKPNAPVLPDDFKEAYLELANRVRDIVSDLRPPMLAYGLKYALDGLADNLAERNQDTIRITATIDADGTSRYSDFVENNIYRIVQEACENALKYAKARTITIHGELSATMVDITVADDGIGFKDEISLVLTTLLAEGHFGLAGMHERAELIGAEIRIMSKPSEGAQVRVMWELEESI